MSPEFCEYLRNYKWKGDVYMLREGTVCYPQVPMVRIECDMVGAVLMNVSITDDELPFSNCHKGNSCYWSK